MHSVLLFVEKPTSGPSPQRDVWPTLLATASHIVSTDAAVQTLGESCWLIPLRTSMHSFVTLASLADTQKLAYRLMFFPDEPRWLRTS